MRVKEITWTIAKNRIVVRRTKMDNVANPWDGSSIDYKYTNGK